MNDKKSAAAMSLIPVQSVSQIVASPAVPMLQISFRASQSSRSVFRTASKAWLVAVLIVSQALVASSVIAGQSSSQLS